MDGVTGSVYNDVVSSGQEMSDATRSCSGWHALWHWPSNSVWQYLFFLFIWCQ